MRSLYFIMGRKNKRCPKKCPKHTFLLKPVHYSAVFSRQLQASYCPNSGVNSSITPKFNNDKKYFTVSFYLPVDSVMKDQPQQKISKNEDFYRNEHEKYKMEHTSEKSNIFQAKPKSKYSYCNVCKVDYEDYLQHIRCGDHKKKVKENQFSFYISQLCQQIKEGAQKELQLQNNDSLQEIQAKNCGLFLTSSLYFSQKLELNREKNVPISLQFKERAQLLPTYKSFYAYSEANEKKNYAKFDQHDLIIKNPPFSPIKRYSEVTEGVRMVSNLRPIILHGSRSEINF